MYECGTRDTAESGHCVCHCSVCLPMNACESMDGYKRMNGCQCMNGLKLMNGHESVN